MPALSARDVDVCAFRRAVANLPRQVDVRFAAVVVEKVKCENTGIWRLPTDAS